MAHTLLVHSKLPRGITRKEIARRTRVIMKKLSVERASLSVVLTDDEEIHALNRDYRAMDKPTDVLAFAVREGEFGHLAGDELGDVIISVETAQRQASEAGKTLMDELTMLLAHGILHLLGWDHDTKKKDIAMRAKTDELCASCEAAEQPTLARLSSPAAKVKRKSARQG